MPVLLRATLTAIAMLWGSSASAQDSSNRDVNLIVAGGSGSAVDQAARALASALSPILRGRVEIQNRPAVLAIREAAKAAPDGRTLFVAPSTAIITAQMSQSKSSLEEALAPWSELAPVSLLATNSWALVVNRNSPWKDLTDFLTAAATSRQPINLGFTGAGNSGGPVVAKLLMNDLGIPVQYIPFAGEAAAVKTLREGQLHAAIVAIQVALPDLRTGDIRGLAISDTERSPLAAQIPTFRELGYEHVQYLGWIALFAPPKTPERTVSTFNEAASAATRNFEFQDLIERIGFRPMYRGPLELRKILIQVITRITTSRELEAHIGPEGGGSTSRISCESIGNVYSTSKCSSNCTEICKLYGRGLKACNKGGAC